MNVTDHACRRCGAVSGQPCATAAGKPSLPHARRLKDALASGGAPSAPEAHIKAMSASEREYAAGYAAMTAHLDSRKLEGTISPDISAYRGRSLSYIRHLLHQTEPLFPDVTAFAAAHADDLDPRSYPEIGQVVLFATGKHGDIGLYVGGGVALHLNPYGFARLLPFDPGGTYLGAMWWPDTDSTA